MGSAVSAPRLSSTGSAAAARGISSFGSQALDTGSAAAARGISSGGSQALDTGSAAAARELSRAEACGILADQGSNSCLLHQQAGSLPLSHQGSPGMTF